MNYTSNEIEKEKCILVGVIRGNESEWETRDHLFELAQLAHTAGAQPVDQVIQSRIRLDPAYFIGKGKARELATLLVEKGCQLAIFDDDLTPAQVRNLEIVTDVKIIDRSGLILDIFAQHARSRESRTQVELAQLNYLLPRLTRQWTHLSRQVGGIGTKGPGETQLETDRRLIRTRIAHLRNDLTKIEKQRKTQRKKRSETFQASLVGYTNVGKSTIMNAITGADVLVENQLFATLDATTRKLQLKSGTEILVSDTVGFIRKLPHHLVASFRTTLDEVRETDLIIHVVDISSPNFKAHIDTVNDVLKEMGVEKKPLMIVFNKVDLIDNPALIRDMEERYPNSVFISASRGIRLQRLIEVLTEFVEMQFITKNIKIDQKFYNLIHYIHEEGVILATDYQDNFAIFKVKMDVGKMNGLLKEKDVSQIDHEFPTTEEET